MVRQTSFEKTKILHMTTLHPNTYTVCVNKTNLGTLLVNNREKLKPEEKSGVYELKCADCEALYIGQTGRAVQVRIKEHKSSILNNKKCTGLADHCITNNHFIDTTNCTLLHSQQKGQRLNLLEQLEIQRAIRRGKNIVNEQTDFNNSPLLKTVL